MTGRQCFPCTACCEGWLMAEINEVKMMPGKPCIHEVKTGFGIYEKRPQDPCVSFNCCWMHKHVKLPDHMKPSEFGAIVIVDRNWHNWKVIRTIPTVDEIPGKSLDWLMAFVSAQSTPPLLTQHLYKNGKYAGFKKPALSCLHLLKLWKPKSGQKTMSFTRHADRT